MVSFDGGQVMSLKMNIGFLFLVFIVAYLLTEQINKPPIFTPHYASTSAKGCNWIRINWINPNFIYVECSEDNDKFYALMEVK